MNMDEQQEQNSTSTVFEEADTTAAGRNGNVVELKSLLRSEATVSTV